MDDESPFFLTQPVFCQILVLACSLVIPEEQLWQAVLLQAVDDFVAKPISYHGKPSVTACRAAARAWFFSDGHEPGSFLFVCQALNIDPGAIRRGLKTQNVGAIRERMRFARSTNYVSRPPLDAMESAQFHSAVAPRVVGRIR